MTPFALEAQRIVDQQPELAKEIARLVSGSVVRGGLTVRQRELLLFIRRYIGEHGHSPSFEEMKEALGLGSKSGIHRLMQGLKERGFVDDRYGQSRSVVLRRAS